MSANGNRQAVSADPALLRAEIVRTRAELGETVAALAAKTDVKARASRAATDVRGRLRDTARAPRTWALVATGALGGALVWLVWQRRSNTKASIVEASQKLANWRWG